ncbi:MAG TPA: STAS domain-containing protein [Leptospiraceae bacterium]|nr:STAS domain-containing protein [Leptospiraceae bacterium]
MKYTKLEMPDCVTFYLETQPTHFNSGELKADIEKAAGENGRNVVLDLSALREIEIANISFILRLNSFVAGFGGRLKIQGIPDRIRAVLRFIDIETIIDMTPDPSSILISR